MEKTLVYFLTKHPVFIISLSIVSLNIYLFYINNIKLESELMYVILLFLGILSLLSIFFTILKKCCIMIMKLVSKIIDIFKRTYNNSNSLNNYDYLEKKEQDILWKLFFNEKLKLKLYETNVQNLLSKSYIKEVDRNEYQATSIFELKKHVKKFLYNKYNYVIEKKLQNLTADEISILEMFYTKQENETYVHPYINVDMHNAICKLNDEGIIKKYNVKYIRLENIASKNISFMKNKLQRTKIELDLEKVAPLINSGGGAMGSNYNG